MYLYFCTLVSFYQLIIKSTFYVLPKSIIDLESEETVYIIAVRNDWQENQIKYNRLEIRGQFYNEDEMELLVSQHFYWRYLSLV